MNKKITITVEKGGKSTHELHVEGLSPTEAHFLLHAAANRLLEVRPTFNAMDDDEPKSDVSPEQFRAAAQNEAVKSDNLVQVTRETASEDLLKRWVQVFYSEDLSDFFVTVGGPETVPPGFDEIGHSSVGTVLDFEEFFENFMSSSDLDTVKRSFQAFTRNRY